MSDHAMPGWLIFVQASGSPRCLALYEIRRALVNLGNAVVLHETLRALLVLRDLGCDVCERCAERIDPDVCACGECADDHGPYSNHAPHPMGCRCGLGWRQDPDAWRRKAHERFVDWLRQNQPRDWPDDAPLAMAADHAIQQGYRIDLCMTIFWPSIRESDGCETCAGRGYMSGAVL